ncbi:MAG: hypothetical protein AB7F28_01580 [Candidatus Margulisiibacteriota bacterium]
MGIRSWLGGFFLLLLATSVYPQYDNKNLPVMDFALRQNLQNMRAQQTQYTTFVFYTINMDTPGYIEHAFYNARENGIIRGKAFPRWRESGVKETNRQLDFLIDAESRGFFTILLPYGILGYTRDGRFKLGENGHLITFAGGYPVLGEEGEIYLPIGDIAVSKSGVLSVNSDRVAKLRIAVMPSKTLDRMVEINGSVFYLSGKEPVELLEGEQYYAVRQGFLEESNVLKALNGDILIVKQSYEASTRAVKSLTKTMTSSFQIGTP